MKRLSRFLFCAAALTLPVAAFADPCGMVPPIWEGEGPAITRVGAQITYVFYKDGVESFVIRPGFEGKVDEFGMLIPFPSPPALRKVDDDIFGQIARAIDPPTVTVDLTPRPRYEDMAMEMSSAAPAPSAGAGGVLDVVRVIKEEAVGMYEVAVLEAGSAAALQRWLDDHGYQYPKGMGEVTQDYVNLGWCFVAVKTKVGTKKGVTPRAGMTSTDSKLPGGSSFDGNVQAMGFRFKSDELVVPMRLSAFNEGELHNIVYVLSDTAMRPNNMNEGLVTRQLSGNDLFKHVTDPLPLVVIGGTVDDIPASRRQTLPRERDPIPHNGMARDLFASDLLAVRLGKLTLPHEEKEKVLLRIGERLGLRGDEIDVLHRGALQEARQVAVSEALIDLRGMTLTVIDGDFPREVIATENVSFTAFGMPGDLNTPQHYDAKKQAPAEPSKGLVYGGTAPSAKPTSPRWWAIGIVFGIAIVCVGFGRRAA